MLTVFLLLCLPVRFLFVGWSVCPFICLSVNTFLCFNANTCDEMTHVHYLPDRICLSSFIIVKFCLCLYPFQFLYIITVIGIEDNLHCLFTETQC